MVNNMTKKTAKAILFVYKNDMTTNLNDTAKQKLITLLNNVIQISYQRSTSAAQMLQNAQEAFSYIADYLKDQCKGTNFMFTYLTDTDEHDVSGIIRCRYGLVDDNLPFSCDINKAFKKMRGE